MIEASRSVSVAAVGRGVARPVLEPRVHRLGRGLDLAEPCVLGEGVEDLALDLDGDGLATDLQGLQELALGLGSDMAHQDLPRAGGAAVGDQRGGPVLEVGAGGEEQRGPQRIADGRGIGDGNQRLFAGMPGRRRGVEDVERRRRRGLGFTLRSDADRLKERRLL